MTLADEATDQFSVATSPAFLVNIFPTRMWFIPDPYTLSLIHKSVARLPEWFPGTGFLVVAKRCRTFIEQMCKEPLSIVKKRMVQKAISTFIMIDSL